MLVALTAVLSAPALAQTTRTATVQGVKLTLSLDKTRLHVGEPLTLTTRMENVSDVTLINLSANFQLSEGNSVEVMVQPPRELPYRYSGARMLGVYPKISIPLLHDQPKTVDTLLLFDPTQPSGLLFPRPGTYSLTIGFTFQLNSKPTQYTASLPQAEITVVEAVGAHKAALDLLDQPEEIRALQLGTVPTTAILHTMIDAANNFPKTELGALAMRAEGLHYVHSRDPQYERGAQILQDYLANGIVPAEPDGAAWSIAAAYHHDKQYDLARAWTFYLVRNFPMSLRIRPQDALVYHYFLQPAEFAAQVPWYLLKEPWKVPGVKPPDSLQPRQGPG